MKEENAPSLYNPEVMFLSFFGVGFLPKAPGTWGTLAICPLLYVMGQFNAPPFIFIPFLIMVTIVSCFVADFAQKAHEVHDPSWIVIDKVLGMWTTWLFTLNHQTSLPSMLYAFFLFRFLNIFKVFPATYFDKRVNHGAGRILDDLVSGIFAGSIYYYTFPLFLNIF